MEIRLKKGISVNASFIYFKVAVNISTSAFTNFTNILFSMAYAKIENIVLSFANKKYCARNLYVKQKKSVFRFAIILRSYFEYQTSKKCITLATGNTKKNGNVGRQIKN